MHDPEKLSAGEDAARDAAARDAALEREIREEQRFTLAAAVGRMGGGDLMKGASPVTRQRQAEVAIELYLERHLVDPEGALHAVLLRRVRESEAFLQGDYDRPLAALAGYVGRLLAAEVRLREFVHEVDAEWGRVYGERPYFQREGCPADPRDPYTFDSVRGTLAALAEGLAGASGAG